MGRLALNAVLLLSLAACVVSGVMVSGTVLPSMGLYASGYHFWDPLHAVAAKVDREAVEHMHPGPDEVDETFLVPLEYLLTHPPMDLSYKLVPEPGPDFPYEQAGIPRDYAWRLGRETVPVYRWRDRVIWGLTGRITRNLLGYIRRLPRET